MADNVSIAVFIDDSSLVDLTINPDSSGDLTDYALYLNKRIGTLTLNNITTLGECSCANMENATAINIPNNQNTIIKEGCFFNNKNLEKINTPSTSYVEDSAGEYIYDDDLGAYRLINEGEVGTHRLECVADLSNIKIMSGFSTFAQNSKLTKILLDSWTTYSDLSTAEATFDGCSCLREAKLSVGYLVNNQFGDCIKLTDVYLLKTDGAVVWTEESNPFTNAGIENSNIGYKPSPEGDYIWDSDLNAYRPITSGETGTHIQVHLVNIHVPSNLLAQYQDLYDTDSDAWMNLNFVENENNGAFWLNGSEEIVEDPGHSYNTWADYMADYSDKFSIQYGLVCWNIYDEPTPPTEPQIIAKTPILKDINNNRADENDLAIRPSDFIDFSVGYTLMF